MVFIEAETECWKCGAVIKVYTWEGHELWAEECPEEGRPGSVKWRTSEIVERGYWANTCSECGIIQGDWFLYIVNGVFGGEALVRIFEIVEGAQNGDI